MTAQPKNVAQPDTTFLSVATPRQLADFLGVSYSTFTLLVYRKPEDERYRAFEISKKSGAKRLIEAPILPIRRMQEKVAASLTTLYQPRPCVLGFVEAGGIVRNARAHARRTWIVNFDLEDFFHSIHFGRLLKIFQGWRFNFSGRVAAAIANLCCHKGRLPMGAPTSPVLANIACDRLDKDLIGFAKVHGCHYTRYSDDITFSTRRRDLPEAIATRSAGAPAVVSPHIQAIVEKHRLRVNHAKTRVRHRTERQDVTGLTVNVRPNVVRRYVRQIRAMLVAWQRHGLAAAQAEHHARWNKKDRRPGRPQADYRKVVRGKIEFLGHVRGPRDPIYVRFLRLYCHLQPNAKSRNLAMIDAETRDVFLCHASEDKEAVVNPIAQEFDRARVTYFLDSKEILWGDSVTNVINRALIQAKYVVVVISRKSLGKHWPTTEMNAALAQEITSGKTRVLPLLVASSQAEADELWSQLALQGDKRYLKWAGDPGSIVAEIQKRLVVKP